MESSSKRKSDVHSYFHRLISPTGRFSSSSMSTFIPRPAGIITRPDFPTRVCLRGPVSKPSSVQFSSPRRSIAVAHTQKKTCMCSPTTHRGSFRCSLHKNVNNSRNQQTVSSHRLNARRSAMTNSLVRIGTVEGELVKRALSALIRPSSHQQKRRSQFQPKRSRLSIMSKAQDF